MRVHTVVIASVLGMAASSAAAWSLGPGGAVTTADARVTAADPEKKWESPGADSDTPDQLAVAAKARSEFSVEGTVKLTGRMGHPVIADGRSDDTFVFLNLSAQQEAFGASVTPADVTIVIDRSGSMRGARMDMAIAAARGMVSNMRNGDTVSVVSYDANASVVVPPTRIDPRSRGEVMARVLGVRPGGHTCVSCGVEQALALAPRGRDTAHRVLLLSDGKANRGLSTSSQFASVAQMARRTQSSVTSIGLGIDYDERLLSSLSRQTNGFHHFAERPDQLQPIFEQELEAVSKTVAAAASVDVTLAPGVQLLEVMDRANTRDGNRINVPFGTFTAGTDKTLLLRVRLPAGQQGIRSVGDFALNYTDAATGRRELAQGALEVTVGSQTAELDPTVEARVAQSETVRELDAANALLAAGREDEARVALGRSRSRVKKRRKAASGRGSFAPAAARSFDVQEQTLNDAFKSAGEARTSRLKGDANAPKRASKANTQALNPFL